MGIGDLTITGRRQRIVDFVPFMHHGLSIAYAEPKPMERNTFSFLSPFSKEVWISTGIAYILVSLALFTTAR